MIENTTTNDKASSDMATSHIWRVPFTVFVGFALVIGLFFLHLYDAGLNRMINSWFDREEYGHGLLIPFISLFLIWQKKDILEICKFESGYSGIALVFFGIFMVFLGEISAITIFIQYGFIFTITGLVLTYMGWNAFKNVAIPFVLLFFMVPLPGVIFQELSQYLQLISTQIGVFVIRLFDISVYVEGNVIDLGVYKLQVVEACSGLNYLFPLMTLGFIAAYFYKVETWKRVVIFLSSIPITVLMNSFRIGVIGVTVEYWGIDMAEGFLHDFEGWVVFMACTGLLVMEMWLFVYFSNSRRPLLEVFGLEFPAESPSDATVNIRPISKHVVVASAMIILATVVGYFSPERTDLIVDRKEFSDFPKVLGDWDGSSIAKQFLDKEIIDALKFDDYLLASYVNNENGNINLYIAYYGSQSKGASIHSPRACLPAGGWQVKEISDYSMNDVLTSAGKPLKVNRVLIQMGEAKQLVYYWFPQRGRNITDEYVLKWYVFWDSLTMKRSDGALIRVTTLLNPNDTIADADQRLMDFIQTASPVFNEYIPENIN